MVAPFSKGPSCATPEMVFPVSELFAELSVSSPHEANKNERKKGMKIFFIVYLLSVNAIHGGDRHHLHIYSSMVHLEERLYPRVLCISNNNIHRNS